jgi:hypothetical protein
MKLVSLGVAVCPLYPFDVHDITPVTLKKKGKASELLHDPLQATPQEGSLDIVILPYECDLYIIAFRFYEENIFGIDLQSLPIVIRSQNDPLSVRWFD